MAAKCPFLDADCVTTCMFYGGSTSAGNCKLIGSKGGTVSVSGSFYPTTQNVAITSPLSGSKVDVVTAAAPSGAQDVNITKVGGSAVQHVTGALGVHANIAQVGNVTVVSSAGVQEVSTGSGAAEVNLTKVGGSLISQSGGVIDVDTGSAELKVDVTKVGSTLISQSGGVIDVDATGQGDVPIKNGDADNIDVEIKAPLSGGCVKVSECSPATEMDVNVIEVAGNAISGSNLPIDAKANTIGLATQTTLNTINTKIGTFAAGNLATYLQNTLGDAADVALTPAGSVLYVLKDMGIDDIIRALIGSITPSATKNVLYGLLGSIAPTATSTLQAIFGYTGSGTSTLKDALNYSGVTGADPSQTLREALETSRINVLKALGFADTDLGFGVVGSGDDLKRNLGFDNESGGLDDANLQGWLANILGIDADKLGTEQTLLMIEKHVHDSHMHASQHDAATVPADPGGKSTIVPLASLLIGEFMGSEDLDGTGKIYGEDYMIDGSDENMPPMHRGLEQNPEWENPDCKITWEEYEIWIGGGATPACMP